MRKDRDWAWFCAGNLSKSTAAKSGPKASPEKEVLFIFPYQPHSDSVNPNLNHYLPMTDNKNEVDLKYYSEHIQIIKAPINNIIGFTQLLEFCMSGTENPCVAKYIEVIREEAEHAISYIDAMNCKLNH